MHVIFNEDEDGIRELGLGLEGWSSRYADPAAEGVRPVLRTVRHQYERTCRSRDVEAIQILRSSSGCRVRTGRSVSIPALFEGRDEAKTGGRVPLGGPLMRRLSVITHDLHDRQSSKGKVRIGTSGANLVASISSNEL